MKTIAILTVIAEIIGFSVLLFIVLMVIITIAHVVHDFIRSSFPKYDRWLYDEVRRQNARKR